MLEEINGLIIRVTNYDKRKIGSEQITRLMIYDDQKLLIDRIFHKEQLDELLEFIRGANEGVHIGEDVE